MPETSAEGSTGSGSTSAPGSSSSGDDTGGACEPDPPGNACLECVVPNCCGAWAQCQADEGCACMIECHVVKGGSLGSCKSQCNSDGELYEGVFFCGQMFCLDTCEWDCC